MTDHKEDTRSKATQDIEELASIEKESQAQKLPEQKVVFKTESIKSRAGRRGVHNLPDQTNPPMGFDPVCTIFSPQACPKRSRRVYPGGSPNHLAPCIAGGCSAVGSTFSP